MLLFLSEHSLATFLEQSSIQLIWSDTDWCIEWSEDIHLYHVIWMVHCNSPVLSVLDLTLEYVKTVSFQYYVNHPDTQIYSQSF
jgi:hypothetical protein